VVSSCWCFCRAPPPPPLGVTTPRPHPQETMSYSDYVSSCSPLGFVLSVLLRWCVTPPCLRRRPTHLGPLDAMEARDPLAAR
jgi:hypothetical protein